VPTKDYVKRERSRTQASRKPHSKFKAGRPVIKYGVIFVIILTAVGIGASVVHHRHKEAAAKKTDSVTQTTSVTTQSQKTKTNTTEKTNDITTPPTKLPNGLPIPPEAHWTYVDQLENKVIIVKENKQYDLPTVPFQMQCGAYRSRAQAEARQDTIAAVGYDSMIKISRQKSTWYRVVLGPYKGRRAAGVIRAKLHTKGIEGCAVWQWNE
jgi:cell division protein FtsN